MEEIGRNYAEALYELFCLYQDSLPELKELIDPRESGLLPNEEYQRIMEIDKGLGLMALDIFKDLDESLNKELEKSEKKLRRKVESEMDIPNISPERNEEVFSLFESKRRNQLFFDISMAATLHKLGYNSLIEDINRLDKEIDDEDKEEVMYEVARRYTLSTIYGIKSKNEQVIKLLESEYPDLEIQRKRYSIRKMAVNPYEAGSFHVKPPKIASSSAIAEKAESLSNIIRELSESD